MISFEVVIILLSTLLALNLLLIAILVLTKKNSRKAYAHKLEIHRVIITSLLEKKIEQLEQLYQRNPKEFIIQYRKIYDETRIKEDAHNRLIRLFIKDNWHHFFIKKLRSRVAATRMLAASVLKVFPSKLVRSQLEKAFKRERRQYVKLAIFHTLIKSGHSVSSDFVKNLLSKIPERYVEKYIKQLEQLNNPWKVDFEVNQTISFSQAVIVILNARNEISREHGIQVLTLLQHMNSYVSSYARDTLKQLYGPFALSCMLEKDSDSGIAGLGIELKGLYQHEYQAKEAVNLWEQIAARDEAASLHTGFLNMHRSFLSRFPSLVDTFYMMMKDDYLDIGFRKMIALACLRKIDFIIQSYTGKDAVGVTTFLELLIEQGYTSDIIDFVNTSTDQNVKKHLLPVIKAIVVKHQQLEKQLRSYLNAEFLEQIGLSKGAEEPSKEKIPVKNSDKLFLFMLLLWTVALYPLYFFFFAGNVLSGMSIQDILIQFILQYNYFFAFYSIALNSVYFVLLIFSAFTLIRQARLWAVEDYEFLFSPGIMPSVSILAPAYNEEKSVVQSVNSLLNLKYPDYEVIVINDGSADNTIGTLISEFKLEKIDRQITEQIPSAPIRGIYKNPDYPNLTVIDKENGGKADALNSGINIAQNEFICSIDADSLLEPDALLKIMYQHNIHDDEVIAIGGNIIPVNGCQVKKGSLKEIHIPGNTFAQFQTIEYIRSFIAGRMGWSAINSLLIISGAFGLFSRRRVLEIGGYMTGKGRFKKDTVGEDMELVVRLYKHMCELKQKFKISYAHNANCWTEVPEDFSSMNKQRDRWHRGLIEIMTFYKHMLFNPGYKQAGLIAFPYFYVFELFGPFLEFFGYLVLISSAILGILNVPIFLFLFSVVILYGIVISLSSLVLSENQVVYFKGFEFLKILGRAFIENFGYRQYMSMLRTKYLLSYLVSKPKGWQKLKRKGFIQTDQESGRKP